MIYSCIRAAVPLALGLAGLILPVSAADAAPVSSGMVIPQLPGSSWQVNTGTPLGLEPNHQDMMAKWGCYFYPNPGDPPHHPPRRNWDEVYDYCQSVGLTIHMFNSFEIGHPYDKNYGWGQSWWAKPFGKDPRTREGSGFVPMASVEPGPQSPSVSSGWDNTANFNDIISGKNDFIYERARNCWIESGFTKIKMRVGHEWNGDWYGYCGNTPERARLFVQAFRHISKILKADPRLKVDVVWNMSVSNSNRNGVFFADYYPGDEYVDSIGIDMYEWCYTGTTDKIHFPIWNPDGTFSGKFTTDIGEWAANPDNRLKMWNVPTADATHPQGKPRTGVSVDDCYRFAWDHGKMVDWCEGGDDPRYDQKPVIWAINDDPRFIQWVHDKIAYWHRMGVYTGFTNFWYVALHDGMGSQSSQQPPPDGREKSWALTQQLFGAHGSYTNAGLGIVRASDYGGGYLNTKPLPHGGGIDGFKAAK